MSSPLLNREIQIFESIDHWSKRRSELKTHRCSIGFVPTMGALHRGHLALVRRALSENNYALVSIFVNPTQFNNKDDLENYPRNNTHDINKLSQMFNEFSSRENVNPSGLGLLLPSENEIYADNYKYKISENEKSKVLCGAFRPGHFDGVLTVVMKLLGIAQADKCYMGEKDYQQYLLVKEMAENFFLSTQVLPHPTLREKSGLALSSRNELLSPEGRIHAACLYKLLNSKKTTHEIKDQLESQNFKVEYVSELWGRRFVAAWLDNVRLIDNVEV